MTIHFICPHCAAPTDVSEKYAGQTGPCASCGKPITIPTPEVTRPARLPISTSMVVLIAAVLVVMGVAGVGMLAVWLLPSATSADRETLHRMECVDNLKQIALAMLQYEAAEGCFPPSYLADRHGKPMHSWRVLLLPYLDQQDLYDRYRFDEPWNSPYNRAVTDLTIGLFQCPDQPDLTKPTTNYMMVVGPHMISNGRDSRKIAEITDGLANTILLVEVADSTTCWAEPADLHFDQLDFAVNGSRRPGISSHHPGGANVAFCAEQADTQNETVRFLKDATNPYLVKAMLTIDGSEE